MASVRADKGIAKVFMDRGAPFDAVAAVRALGSPRIVVYDLEVRDWGAADRLRWLRAMKAGPGEKSGAASGVQLIRDPRRDLVVRALNRMRTAFQSPTPSEAIAGDPRLHELFELFDLHRELTGVAPAKPRQGEWLVEFLRRAHAEFRQPAIAPTLPPTHGFAPTPATGPFVQGLRNEARVFAHYAKTLDRIRVDAERVIAKIGNNHRRARTRDRFAALRDATRRLADMCRELARWNGAKIGGAVITRR